LNPRDHTQTRHPRCGPRPRRRGAPTAPRAGGPPAGSATCDDHPCGAAPDVTRRPTSFSFATTPTLSCPGAAALAGHDRVMRVDRPCALVVRCGDAVRRSGQFAAGAGMAPSCVSSPMTSMMTRLSVSWPCPPTARSSPTRTSRGSPSTGGPTSPRSRSCRSRRRSADRNGAHTRAMGCRRVTMAASTMRIDTVKYVALQHGTGAGGDAEQPNAAHLQVALDPRHRVAVPTQDRDCERDGKGPERRIMLGEAALAQGSRIGTGIAGASSHEGRRVRGGTISSCRTPARPLHRSVSQFTLAGAWGLQASTVPTGSVAATHPVSMRGSASIARRSGSGPAT
jgi:hypothetical protein